MFYRSGWLRCVGLISVCVLVYVSCVWVIDVRCYIVYYIIIYYTYTYIIYYILFSSFLFPYHPLPIYLLPNIPFLSFCSMFPSFPIHSFSSSVLPLPHQSFPLFQSSSSPIKRYTSISRLNKNNTSV